MSALAIITLADQVTIACDGAVYEAATGAVAGTVLKVVPLPHLSAVVSYVGVANLGQAFVNLFGPRPKIFEDLLEHAVDNARLLKQERPDMFDSSSTLVLSGWSYASSRFETWKLHTHPRRAIDIDTGQETVLPAWQLLQVEEIWCSEAPTSDDMERFGMKHDQTARDLSVRMVCAARSHSTGPYEASRNYGVGAFILVTELRREHVASSVIHRWPDDLGSPIDPTVGEPLPSFLVSTHQEDRDHVSSTS